MEQQIHKDSVKKLVNAFEQSLRGKISPRSDVQDGLILIRQRLLILSSRYSRAVLYHLCHQFVPILFKKLNFKPSEVKVRYVTIPEKLESLSSHDNIPVEPAFSSYFVGQLMSEIDLAPLERSESAYTSLTTFVSIPHSLLQNWLVIAKQEKLPWRAALVYLAACIAIYRHSGATEKQICGYTGINQKTVQRHLKKLTDKYHLLFKILTEIDSKKQLSLYEFPPATDRAAPLSSFNIILETKEPWFADLDPFKDKNEIEWAPFAPWMPKNAKSPLIQPFYDHFDAHERSLEAILIVASCFSQKQIYAWLKHAHGNHYRTLIPAIKDLFFTQIQGRFSFPERKHRHYLQISRALPLVMYAARREFRVDLAQAFEMTKLTHTEIKLAWHNFIVVWEVMQLEEGFNGRAIFLDWNAKYFLTCFLHTHPFHRWVKRYPDIFPKIPLARSLMSQDLKWVTLTKTLFNLDFLENLIERSTLADVFVSVIRLFNKRKHLHQLRKSTYSVNTITPRGITKSLDNASHRMYTIDTPRQSIPKQLRPIFLAKQDYQFIMFDIRQNDLQLWLALLPKFSSSKADNINSLVFEDIALSAGMTRDAVKHLVYQFFYGASKNRIMLEFALNQKQWLQLERLIFKIFRPMKRSLIKDTEQNGFTPPTPLNYRIPINKKYYRAPSLYIQAIGAEILREWILQLHIEKLSPFIVNIIHDEIVMEVPVSTNLYQLSEKVQECLDKAKIKLLSTATLSIRAKASRRWGSDASVVIVP